MDLSRYRSVLKSSKGFLVYIMFLQHYAYLAKEYLRTFLIYRYQIWYAVPFGITFPYS